MNIENNFFVRGKIVDVHEARIYSGEVEVGNGRIKGIKPAKNEPGKFILPGLVDAHVHIESSMLTPGNFSTLAVKHGTVATVSDPHEIANVLGKKGIDFMIEDGKKVPFKFFFGAPSCVPATSFESSGSVINAREIKELLGRKEIFFLSEMMNYPGVLNEDKEIRKKIHWARKAGKRIDGHAPGLNEAQIRKYAGEGISTDHECVSIKEAREKIAAGMKIQIREGSAAKNFEELSPLIDEFPDDVMLCTDDMHPDDLIQGHIDQLIRRGIEKNIDLFSLIKAATLNPVKHYKLNVGLLQKNDPADFIVVENLTSFRVLSTYIDGKRVYHNDKVEYEYRTTNKPNHFIQNYLEPGDLQIKAEGEQVNTIIARDGDLYTRRQLITPVKKIPGIVVSDTETDMLKICVQNRYNKAKPAVGFIRGFGLQTGAIASSIAHDSHNIIGLGTNDPDLCRAMNKIIEMKGGIAAVRKDEILMLELPVGGIISDDKGENVAAKYHRLNQCVRSFGSGLSAPFMTLSFMTLLVIPELKICDRGLFNVEKFRPIGLFDPE